MIKTLKIILLLVFIAGVGYLVMFTNREHRKAKCSGLDIELLTGDEDSLITHNQVKNLIDTHFDSLTERSLENISISKIEETLKNNPFIKDVDVFVTMNRKIKVKILSYTPLVRVIINRSQSFYLDTKGYFVPVNPHHPMHVVLTNGNLNTHIPDSAIAQNLHFKKINNFSVIKEIFNLAKQINTNQFLNAQVEQIYRNQENEYELIPKIGDQLIIFGAASKIERKLKKLEAVYKQAIPKSGWKTYKAINLKYENQVVCSK